MASLENAPYASQDVQEVASMLKALQACTKKSGAGKKALSSKKTTFEISDAKGLSVDSWRFQEWDYKRRDLPTYARGLFTYNKKDGTAEIATRGYDKFFNVGEVHETQWDNVAERTKGPYELSVKENGCIIFISGLEGDRLLVCSKHSTGPRSDADTSHAVAGERWVEKQLKEMGKTKTDLARELRKRNVTAVAELCDDSFEEHVLAYDEKSAGLYLHGVNLNLPEFATYPGELVHAFADLWGFKKAEYVMKDDLDTVKTFLDGCAETGSWNGRDTEGFVIRCRRKEHHDKTNYQDWFFKYKFEEPYLMYRQWREATKAVIAGRAPRFKKHKAITEDYLLYARRQLAKNAKLAAEYNKNHGIIAMRDGFLQERGSQSRNVVLVPVASIGCGKTTVAVALTKLFEWGHVQNDNITGKQNRPKQFVNQITISLATHPVIIADRNNHQKRERKQLIDDVSSVVPDARFIALHYIHDPKPQMLPSIRKITQKRVLERGDNHQTIQANSKGPKAIIDIMEGFLSRFEPLNPNSSPDDGFDEIISLDVAAESRENLETVVNALHAYSSQLVHEVPDSNDLDLAIDAALNDYQVDIKHDLSFKSKKSQGQSQKNGPAQANGSAQPKPPKAPTLEFFCVSLPTNEVRNTVDKAFGTQSPETSKFYRQLQGNRRLQATFHVTLMHRNTVSQDPDLWSYLSSLHASAQSSEQPSDNIGECCVRLERIVWDERVMCVVARLVDEGWKSVNVVAHVTMGTAAPNIKPKESNDLLEKWLEVGSGGDTGIGELLVEGSVVLKGDVKAVMQQPRR
ncbi:tRNA ligase [Xanthoria parietina]